MKTFAWLILACWTLLPASLMAGPVPTGPIYTNKLRFRIPFHYDATELGRLGAAKIRLYVSRDLGHNWQLAQEVAPDVGKFTFQATNDGEYWFNVRTVDAKSRELPDRHDAAPGLQVVVDTTPPRLQLQLTEPVAGKVRLSWSAVDEHLDASQLRLEYIQPGVTEWEPVSVIPKSEGSTEWQLPQGGVVVVRGSISDLARNRADHEVQHKVSAASEAVPKPRGPGYRQPVAGPGLPRSGDPALSMSDEFPGSRASDKPPFIALPSKDAADPAIEALKFRKEPPGLRGNFVSQRGNEDFPGAPIILGQTPVAPPAANEQKSAIPDDRRYVNSLRFQLGYKLHDFEPAMISAVELYITQDSGATWYRYHADEDKRSPIQVEVPKEGIYGFVLGVRTTDGKSTDVPQNGEPPAMEVVVDQTPPRIKLLPLRQGTGKFSRTVRIQWNSMDEFPADQPVTVYYAADADGPWHKISDVTEKTGDQTGRFDWTVGSDVPPRFLIRIEARDRAGNIQTAETPRPVVFMTTRPTARIDDVQPSNKPAPQ